MERTPPSSIESTGVNPTVVSFEKIQSLLKAKDDTSRFVGLALLQAVLDNGRLEEKEEADSKALRTLWDCISPKFLDRLLHAGRRSESEIFSPSEANDMLDLAVAILHTFTTLLPEEVRKDVRFTKRIAPLVNALLKSSPGTTTLILQTLVSIVSQPEGAVEYLKIEDQSPLTEIAVTQPLALKVISFAWLNASTLPAEVHAVQKSIDEVIPNLLVAFKETDAVTLVELVGDLLPKLMSEAIPPSPDWLRDLALALRRLITSRPTSTGRAAYTRLASALLQVYPESTPSLLFRDDPSGGAESKPFSTLFINLLLIDLRSSFPSLLAKLNSADYPAISQRLAAAFDVLSSFIGFLVKSLDDEKSNQSFSMPPDLLLKLRKDMAETMSLTIEYLRDRWDSSVAGVSGLLPSARTGTSSTSEGTRLTLVWDSISLKDNVSADPLILAGLRGLAIWVREDENENLRNEAAGLMDMLIELYKLTDSQYRYPVLLALEGIVTTDDGVENFLAQEGWEALTQDLDSTLKMVSATHLNSTFTALSEAARGTQIVRVLLAVLDQPSTSYSQEEWMSTVRSTTSMKVPAKITSSVALEVMIAALQLSTALLSKSSGGMTKRFITKQPALRGLAEQLKSLATTLDDGAEEAEFVELLDDVMMDLENL